MGSITHTHQSAIADDPAADVGADEWNAAHTFTLTKADVGLSNVDNTSDVTKFSNPTINGTLSVTVPPNSSAVLMSGYSVTGVNAQTMFLGSGTINNGGTAVDIFRLDVVNTSNGGGNIMRLKSGPTALGLLDAFKVDLAGDMACSGSAQVLASSALTAGGAIFAGYFIGNFTGGTLGLWGGTGAPTFSTGGKFGGIYMNGASPGIPYFNNNGTSGWDLLVGGAAAQAITNKTQFHMTPQTAPASPASGFTLYVDTADSKLKAKSSAGTVTILALP